MSAGHVGRYWDSRRSYRTFLKNMDEIGSKCIMHKRSAFGKGNEVGVTKIGGFKYKIREGLLISFSCNICTW